jgi:iron complex transport system substrate-binding protein
MTQAPIFRTRRALTRAATALAALSLTGGLLAACGNNDGSDDSADSSGKNSSSTSAASSPVSVTHAMGTTEIPADPDKIVSFSSAFTDAFSALGDPVDVEYRSDYYHGAAPWEHDDSGEVVSAPMAGTPDVEKIAQQDPDVIFAGYVPDKATYDRPNQIAPTVATVGGSTQTDDWREATTIAGEVLGKKDEAEKLVADADRAIDGVKDKYPALKGATGAFGQISDRGLAVVTGDQDPANRFLTDLGIVIPDNIKAASQDGARAFISEENTDLLNTDMLFMWPVGVPASEVPAKVKGWNDLTAVKDGTAFLADDEAARALGTPTILAVTWALDKLDPTFSALQDAK